MQVVGRGAWFFVVGGVEGGLNIRPVLDSLVKEIT